MTPDVSICMATFNRPRLLKRTLESIHRQHTKHNPEVIVVDDGSLQSDENRSICTNYDTVYHHINREPIPRNPSHARNVAYRMAKGPITILQSDDVVHINRDTIDSLIDALAPGYCVFAHVDCLGPDGKIRGVFTGKERQAPLFFLGALFREDLYAIGGNDEDFMAGHACEDQWLADCLTKGRGLTPVYLDYPIGHHQWHPVSVNRRGEIINRKLIKTKREQAERGEIPWCASGGPWLTSHQEIFKQIYQKNIWGGTESRSGEGSSLEATKVIRQAIPNLLDRLGVKTLLDAPCGDCHWIRRMELHDVRYLGVDIVPEIIEQLNSEDWGEFHCSDILQDHLPEADLILCRDCLVHLCSGDISRAIRNFRQNGAKWLLSTTFPRHGNGRVIQSHETGRWRPYNLQAPPFNFPEPVELINEDCRESYPSFQDKSLGLWNLEDLP